MWLHHLLTETRLFLGGGHVQVPLCRMGHHLAVPSGGSSEAVKGRSRPLGSATADAADGAAHGHLGESCGMGGRVRPSCCLATGSSPHLFFHGPQWWPGFVIGSPLCF